MTLPPVLDRGVVALDVAAALFSALAVTLAAMREAGLVGESVRLTDAPPPEFGIGAKGPHVRAWQRVSGADPDGDFGLETQAKTITWAMAGGFGPHITVTPAMWAVASGMTFRLSEPGVVILPDGSRLDVRGAAAEVAAALGPTAKGAA